MVTATFLIRDAGIDRCDIHILQESQGVGGALDGAEAPMREHVRPVELVVLGARNPHAAWAVLGVDPAIGLVLPCHVVVRGLETGWRLSRRRGGSAGLASRVGARRSRPGNVRSASVCGRIA